MGAWLVFLAKRLAQVGLILIVITFVVYVVTMGTRDPVNTMLGDYATPELRAELTDQLNLDQPVVVQYVNWLGAAVQGDLGRSIRSNEAVTSLLGQRFAVSLQLTAYATGIAVLLGVGLGLLAGLRSGKVTDYLVGGVTTLGVAVPNFWLGQLAILLFAVVLRWLPPSGYAPLLESPGTHFRHMLLPSVVLSLEMLAVLARLTRTTVIGSLDQPYVLAARARGLPEPRVIRRYALRTAAVPVLSYLGVRFGVIFGGAIIVEVVFGVPGLGSLANQAILQVDFPVLLGIVTLTGIIVSISTLAVDMAYRVADPRARI